MYDNEKNRMGGGSVELRYRFIKGEAYGRKEPHVQNDRCFPFTVFVYVCEGTYYCASGGRKLAIRQGETLVVPPHTYHTIMMKAPGVLHWAHVSLTVDENDCACGRTAPYKLEGDASEKLGRCLRRLNGAAELSDALRRGVLTDRCVAELFDVVLAENHDAPPEGELDRVCVRMRQEPGEKYTLAGLAALANLSQRGFENRFRAAYGVTPMQYLAECRVKLAAFLLASGKSVKETALRAGYYDAYHFSKRFKSAMGVSPSEYARTHSLET